MLPLLIKLKFLYFTYMLLQPAPYRFSFRWLLILALLGLGPRTLVLLGNAPVDLDSLEAAIPGIQDGRERSRQLGLLSSAYFYSDPVRSFGFAEEMLQIAEEMDNDTMRAEAYSRLGSIRTVQNDSEGAISYFSEGIRYAKSQRLNSFLQTIYLNLGTVYFEMGNRIRGH